MCFSPQRRAIFQHLNFKKRSGADVFCTFSLQNVLLATAACNFWFLLWPHDSAPAALTSLLFDSPDTRIIGKTQRFATPLTFGADVSSFFWLSRYCIFFLLTLLHLLTLLSCDFTSSICFSSAFQLSILSEVYYLNFLRQGSLLANQDSMESYIEFFFRWLTWKWILISCTQILWWMVTYVVFGQIFSNLSRHAKSITEWTWMNLDDCIYLKKSIQSIPSIPIYIRIYHDKYNVIVHVTSIICIQYLIDFFSFPKTLKSS